MNADRPIPNAGDRRGAISQAPDIQSGCYLGSVPAADVMFDQLEYLLAHTGQGCPTGCSDCERFVQVKHWLLLPFLSTRSQIT